MVKANLLPRNSAELDKLFSLVEEEIMKRRERSIVDFYVPQRHQLPFHRSLSQFRFWSTGNRAGKTTAGAVETVWYMRGIHPYRDVPKPPVHIWIVTQRRDQASTIDGAVYKSLREWMPKDEFDPDNGVGKLALGRNGIAGIAEGKIPPKIL